VWSRDAQEVLEERYEREESHVEASEGVCGDFFIFPHKVIDLVFFKFQAR
jgi:hypothetical protein